MPESFISNHQGNGESDAERKAYSTDETKCQMTIQLSWIYKININEHESEHQTTLEPYKQLISTEVFRVKSWLDVRRYGGTALLLCGFGIPEVSCRVGERIKIAWIIQIYVNVGWTRNAGWMQRSVRLKESF